MKAEIRVVRKDVHVLDCSGKITLGPGTEMLRNRVNDVLQKGARKILLNLSGVTYIDSAGVGELVRSYVSATNAGARIKLLGLTGKLRDVLVITHIIVIFEVFDDETAALLSFD
ncbi:MAG: STAS domain-containing protein [Acidobacteria bacterium]|nr:STAS domain-containing protein [Acidobacteriota bacterium]